MLQDNFKGFFLGYLWNEYFSISLEQQKIGLKLNLSPLLNQILFQRGFNSEQEIKSYLYHSPPSEDAYNPKLLKDISKAINRIIEAIKFKQKIVIYGDYDVDGITSSALLYLFFQVYSYFKKEEVQVETILPERVFEGYGLKKAGIEKAIQLGAELIITVDNGISSYEPIEYANQNKIDVIIIDHHSIPESLPPAYAIINPKQVDCLYPYKKLSAVGLVYKVTESLSDALLNEKEKNRFLDRYIDLVAIGTYQDIAPLDDENRYLVKKGIDLLEKIRLSENTNLKGIIELLKATGKINQKVNYRTLGYCIGPMINAAGRIDDPKKAFELLTTKNPVHARELAQDLNKINVRRRELTKTAYKEAVQMIEDQSLDQEYLILIKSTKWHQGIIGLIAQQIAETYRKSCIVMTNANSEHYTASARGYGQFDIGALIQDHKSFFIYHGGHKKAAGFSIKEDNLDQFKESLFRRSMEEQVYQNEIFIEAEIRINEIQSAIYELEKLEPYGEANPEPILAIYDAQIKKLKKSKRGLDTLITICKDNQYLDMVSFNETCYLEQFQINDSIDIALKISKHSSKNDINIEIIDIRKKKSNKN